jgi:2-dehydropantoate 2-reductase
MLPKIAILGAGAVGCALAATLQRQGAQITLLLKPHHPALQQGHCALSISMPTGCFTQHVPCQSTHSCTQFDWFIVCTKCPDTVPALNEIRKQVGPNSLIFLTQNGMGVFEQCQTCMPDTQYILMPCFFGALREQDFKIRLSNPPQIKLGQLPEDAQQSNATQHALCHYFNQHGVHAESSNHILEHLHQKLIINASLNALGALYRCTHQQLLDRQFSAVKSLCQESTYILNHIQFELSSDTLWQYIQALMPTIGSNMSSMFQDIQRKKPTEIQYINGYLVDLAQKYGLPCPLNQNICKRIEAFT